MTGGRGRGGPASRRLVVYNGGFLTETRIRRILTLAGWDVSVGLPGPADTVGVWGASPTSGRGRAVARATGSPVLRVEDAFLRSLFPGRAGEATLGLVLDETGVHFDPERPSDIETLLATHPLDDTALLDRARAAADFMARRHLSKFAATDPDAPLPPAPYVVVIDQTAGDAAVAASGADAATFRDMLVCARIENPGLPVLIKTHPETAQGLRPGHFDDRDLTEGVTFLAGPVSPARLFENAAAVYTVSSGLGFEAIYHGLKPHVFGGPFYAGWGLTQDRGTFPRRRRTLTRAQLFAAAMILYPRWYDPVTDRLTEIETTLYTLDAMARAWREDRQGWIATGMSRWKRPHLDRFFGRHSPVIHGDPPTIGRRRMAWAGRTKPGADIVRLEDGFLRSRGLGAALTPPVSLALDDLGIYYDPRTESRLERLIAASVDLPRADLDRARRLIDRIRAAGLSKYGPGAPPPDLPPGERILVAGQVPDDASLVTAAGEIRTDAALLARARAAHPDATLIYKPHPDVVAGHRAGTRALPDADLTLMDTDPAQLLPLVDRVWTMTSLLGFEALLRGVPVTATGAPFYAGWGLTTDIGTPPDRRRARPGLEGLAHAALIAYPRYSDPRTGLPCPPEAAIHILSRPPAAPRGLLARLQALRARLRG